jgi:hypothetical protein
VREEAEIPVPSLEDNERMERAEDEDIHAAILFIQRENLERDDADEIGGEEQENERAEEKEEERVPVVIEKKPSRYQIGHGNGTINIMTLLVMLVAHTVATKSDTSKMSKDRLRKIAESAKFSKLQSEPSSASTQLVPNGRDIIFNGCWVSIIFKRSKQCGGGYHFVLGMIQRMVQRTPGQKAFLRSDPISLDDEKIKCVWLNIAWLEEIVGQAVPLEYKWTSPHQDATEVSAVNVINVS